MAIEVDFGNRLEELHFDSPLSFLGDSIAKLEKLQHVSLEIGTENLEDTGKLSDFFKGL